MLLQLFMCREHAVSLLLCHVLSVVEIVDVFLLAFIDIVQCYFILLFIQRLKKQSRYKMYTRLCACMNMLFIMYCKTYLAALKDVVYCTFYFHNFKLVEVNRNCSLLILQAVAHYINW